MNDHSHFDNIEIRHLNPEFLRPWGFEERAQSTSDPERVVRWTLALPTGKLRPNDEDCEIEPCLSLELVLHYGLSISDDPLASWYDNLSHDLERVWLQVVDPKRRKAYVESRREFWGPQEGQRDFENEGGIVGLPVHIETVGDLMRLLASFGLKVPIPEFVEGDIGEADAEILPKGEVE